MHRRLFGLSCTLAVLFVGYAIAWLADRMFNGFHDSYTVTFFLLALLLAAMFTLPLLFLFILPQTLVVRWVTRRFHMHRLAPFALFSLFSQLGAVPLAVILNANPLAIYVFATAYLVAACSVLWCISFRHENAA
jgi:hypothetical protein